MCNGARNDSASAKTRGANRAARPHHFCGLHGGLPLRSGARLLLPRRRMRVARIILRASSCIRSSARSLARQMEEMWHALGQPLPFLIVEPGAGSGLLGATDSRIFVGATAGILRSREVCRGGILCGASQHAIRITRPAFESRTLRIAQMTCRKIFRRDALSRMNSLMRCLCTES